MLRNLLIVLIVAFCACICGAGFYYGREIPFAQQWPLFEALRNTAAIIFAVVGAWLAIIYPERLKISFGKNASPDSSNGNMGLLLTPAVHSTVILVFLLLIGITAPILKQISQLHDYLALFRGLSFFSLTILTLWQILIVLMTVIPADLVKRLADDEQIAQDVKNHYSKLYDKQ